MVFAIALWSPTRYKNGHILQELDTLIYCFLVFQHIVYYQSQADAAKILFIWVVLLDGLHTVTLVSAKI